MRLHWPTRARTSSCPISGSSCAMPLLRRRRNRAVSRPQYDRMRPYLFWLILLGSSGCSLIRIGPAADIHKDPRTDAERNLDAIRAMQAEWRSRAAPGSAPSPSSVSPHDVAPPRSRSQTVPSSPSPSPVPSGDASARLPWTPPAAARPPAPDRPVPAYTIPAPVGPDYSGTIRCAPDGLGGQRCTGR
jgi:hypothetical protein